MREPSAAYGGVLVRSIYTSPRFTAPYRVTLGTAIGYCLTSSTDYRLGGGDSRNARA